MEKSKFTLILLFLLLFFSSCIKNNNNNKAEDNKIFGNSEKKLDTILSSDIDSIRLECSFFGVDKDVFFVVNYRDNNLVIDLLQGDKSPKVINSLETKQIFVTYINSLFIQVNEPIYLSIEKRPKIRPNKYTSLVFYGFKDGKEVIKKTVDRENEIYSVRYSMEFIKLRNMLNYIAIH